MDIQKVCDAKSFILDIMPPRRSRPGPKRKPIDPEKENAIKQSKQEYDKQLQELMKLYDDVEPDNIFKCKHPLEKVDDRESGDERSHGKVLTLTPIQKAITFCIQHNGGSATDDEILAFIHRFWSTIVAYSISIDSGNNYQNSKIIDKRVLHINLAINKDNQPLFIKIEENRWKLNDTIPTSASSSTTTSNSSYRPSTRSNTNFYSRDSSSFQDKIMEILKNSKSQSLTIDEIINKATDFKDEDGLFQGSPLDRRVRCVLQIKRILKEVSFDEVTSKWSLKTKQSERQKSFYLPKELKGVKIKELTANELWNVLKEKNIY